MGRARCGPAAPARGQAPGGNPSSLPIYVHETMRALKILVVVMGVMLVVGFAALVAGIAARVSRSGSSPVRVFAARPIDIPRGARIEAITAASDRLVLGLALPDGNRQLLVIDLTTGARLGTVELHPAP